MFGPHYDMLGEFEDHDTKYTLTVFYPPHPPPQWVPAIFTRPGPSKPNKGTMYTIRPSDYDPANLNYDSFEWRHLEDMATKVVKVISARFPADLRCEHVSEGCKCEKGCYVLEKGGKVSRWRCKREDCEGHVYCGKVLKDERGGACFGDKGSRMVCIRQQGF